MTYTEIEKKLWKELGIEGDTPNEISKRSACQEAQRLVDLFVDKGLKTSDDQKRNIKLFFATIREDGTKVNYNEGGGERKVCQKILWEELNQKMTLVIIIFIWNWIDMITKKNSALNYSF